MPCPSDSDLAAYSEGRVAPAARQAIHAHLVTCQRCQNTVRLLALAPSSGSAPTLSAAVSTDDGLALDIAAHHAPGEVLGGKYRVERVVGAGGMGVVLEATHLGLNQKVAIKLLQRDAKRVPGAVDRFVREARACALIKSEHAVRVHDTGQFESGEPYIVMELLAGEDLRSRLAARGVLTVPEAADAIIEACDALEEAHAAGIVHRDIKPANLFVTRGKDGKDSIKVLDFGISKLQAEGVPSLTSQNTTMGSPKYMSPEQLKTPRDVDARTDVWSLGVVLYELCSGRAPFDGESMAGLAAAILTEEPEPRLPRDLDAVVRRCLAKDPSKRYADARALATALRPFASEPGPVSAYEATTLASPRVGRSGATWIVGALTLVIVAVGATGVVLLTRTKPPAAVVPPPPATTTLEIATSPPPDPVPSLKPVASSAAVRPPPVPPRASGTARASTSTAPPPAPVVVPSTTATSTSAALRDRK